MSNFIVQRNAEMEGETNFMDNYMDLMDLTKSQTANKFSEQLSKTTPPVVQ